MRWLAVILILASCTSSRYTQVRLSGSESFDPDGRIVKYEWTRVEGPWIPAVPAQVTTNVNLPKGYYVFALKVTDNQGATSTDTTKITVP